MKHIYFVRHGSTPGNESKLYKVETEPLSENGIKQAEFVAKRFQTIPIDTIVSSEMTRAAQTAEVIAKELGKEIIYTKLFQEIMRPSIVRNRSQKDPDVEAIMKAIADNAHDAAWRHSDEENFHDLRDRATQCIEYLKTVVGENILVVTHGYMLRMIAAVMLFGNDLTVPMFKRLNHFLVTKNTGITYMTEDSGVFRVQTWNDHAHLGEIK
ncbi:MAG: histidine phosphatase family protein [Patescibacteria group bacterium]